MTTTMNLTRDCAFTTENGTPRKFAAGTEVSVCTYRNKPGYTLRVRGTLFFRRVRNAESLELIAC